MAINLDNLTKAQYHYEIGRNGYFAPESGTSEGQFLSTLGYIYMYEATTDMKWLALAEKSIDSALVNIYKGEVFPTNDWDEFHNYIPHWLFCASKPFVSETYYLDKQFEFINGKATFTVENEARKIFQVISSDGKVQWDDPYATFIGTGYTIDSYTTSGNSFTVNIKENYTGKLIVIYSDLGGPTIEVSQNYEAYPIWRALKDGEIAAACDSLFWSYHCFVKMYELTKNERYNTLIKHTQKVIKYACSIQNVADYISPDFIDGTVLNISGMYTDDRQRSPSVTWSRDSSDGSIKIDIPEGKGLFGIGTAISPDLHLENRYYEVCITSDLATPINMEIKCNDSTQTTDNAYNLWQWTQGTGKPEVLKFYLKDFMNTENVAFSYQYSPHKELIYQSPHSSYSFGLQVYGNDIARVVNFNITTEYDDNNNAYSGWCQYQPTLQTAEIDDIPDITYKSTNCIEITFVDADGWIWVNALPQQLEMKTISMRKSDFKLHEKQTINSTDYPSAPNGKLNTLLFSTVSHTAQLQLLRIGSISDKSTAITYIDNIQININKEEAQTIKIHYIRPLPISNYDYAPYVMPFTFNCINGILNTWRGTPYAGYQSPWFWQDVNDNTGVQTNLQFMKDAQESYYKNAGTELKFFMPSFIWNRWDSLKYGTQNTFSWQGADPNTGWGGYQYRALEAVAYTLYRDNTLELAARIVYDFLMSLNKIWDDGQPPTTFNSDGSVTMQDGIDVNGVALIIRTCIYALESEVVSEGLCRSLLNKCLTYLDSLYIDPIVTTNFSEPSTVGTWRSDGMWYQFHGGEMLYSLAILMEFTGNIVNIQSPSGQVTALTIPKKFKDYSQVYTTIQTPIGQQYAKLVDITASNSTSIIVQTPNVQKSIENDSTPLGNSYYTSLISEDGENANVKAVLNQKLSSLYKAQSGIITITSIKGIEGISFQNDIVMTTKYAGTLYSDSYHLFDYVPLIYLPLRCSNGVYDEITGTQVIKRIASDGTVLAIPKTYDLPTALPLFSCGEGAWVKIDTYGTLPNIEIAYPVTNDDSKYIVNNNINTVTNSGLCGECVLGSTTVKDN